MLQVLLCCLYIGLTKIFKNVFKVPSAVKFQVEIRHNIHTLNIASFKSYRAS